MLNPVSQKTVDAIQSETGINTAGFSHMIDGSTVQHIEQRHGENGSADSSMRNVEDLSRVQYVLENYDNVEKLTNANGETVFGSQYRDANNRPAPMIRFEKKVNGTYYVVEAVPDSSAKKLHIVSAYMQKNSGSITQELNMEQSSPQLTPETPLESMTSAAPTIAQNENAVKELARAEAELARMEREYQEIEERYLNAGTTEEAMRLMPETEAAYNRLTDYRKQVETMRSNGAAEQNAAETESAQDTGRTRGLVMDNYYRRAHLASKTSRALDALGEALGVEIRFTEQIENGAVNAMYQDGVITIALDAEMPVITAAVHEAVHAVRKASPEAYAALENFVRGAMSEGQLQFNLDVKRRVYGGQSEGYLAEEVVADAFGRMLDDEALLRRFAQDNRSAAQKLRDALRDIINALRRFLLRQNKHLSALEREAVSDLADRTIAMESLLESVVREAGEQGVRMDGEARSAIIRAKNGQVFVRADRQVIFGNDPQSWSEQLENYINRKIRRGEDVRLIAADGDVLTLTETSAGKLSDYHTSAGRTMSDEAYERKANAAAHIDELAQVSARGNKTVPDHNARHGGMASDGWNYRTAYFEDFDGKYYLTTISTAQNADGRMIYNVGNMKEEAHPKIVGSRAVSGDGQWGFASSDNSLSDSSANVKRKFSLKEDSEGVFSLDDDRISEEKEKMTYDEAEELLEGQEGLSYRFYGRDDPMSRAGYAMFADDYYQNGSAYGGDHKRAFSVSEDDLADYNDIESKIIEARHETDERLPSVLEDYVDLSDEEFAELFNPDDIVQSAAAWDNEGLVMWFYDNVAVPNDIRGVKTYDGAIAFDKDIIKRNLPAETVFTQGIRFSLKRTKENRTFVEVDQDILAGVPKADWVATVKENLSKKFPNGITIGNSEINIDKQSRREMTFSRYMQWLYRNDPQAHADKLRATDNADEILYATTGWVNEGLRHPRRDNIRDFARGEVLLRIGSNDYAADVVVGARKNGAMVLYDVLNLQPTSFTEKETNAAITVNPSPGASRSAVFVSDPSIRSSVEDVNTKFSSKGTRRPGSSEREILDDYVQRYGAIPRGERTSRDVNLPKQTDDDTRVSQTVRTVMEADATPEAALPTLEKMVADGEFSYEVYSDKRAISDASSRIKDVGRLKALDKWRKDVRNGKVSKSGTMSEARNSLKEDGENDRKGAVGTGAYAGSREGQRQTLDQERAGQAGRVRGELSAAGRHGGVNPSFGAKPVRSWAEGHIAEPAKGSVYGLDNPGPWLQNQIKAGKELVLLDKEKANAFLQTYGAYSASVGDGIRSTGESVTRNGAEVKTKFSNKGTPDAPRRPGGKNDTPLVSLTGGVLLIRSILLFAYSTSKSKASLSLTKGRIFSTAARLCSG